MSANLLEQPVYWLLGLPFDAIDIDRAIGQIDAAIAARERLIFATPNVDFVAMAAERAEFKENVLRTDLSLVDGMPLVWLGRALGIPFPHRVAGSTLVERLAARGRSSRVRMHLFGGEAGAGEAARQRINALDTGIEAVGAHFPGMGQVEDMSGADGIAEINRSSPDFLLVALGAEKGHAWIERNRANLQVPVISHLGATINFMAGKIRRAPTSWQRLGLEWLWRIGQEPGLASRYARDALFLLRESLVFVTPEVCRRAFRRRKNLYFRHMSEGDSPAVRLEGSLLASDVEALYRVLADLSAGGHEEIRLDLSGVEDLDSRSIGFLYQLRYRSNQLSPVSLTGKAPTLDRLLRRHRALMLLGRTRARKAA